MRNLLGIFSSIIMLFLLACDNPEVRLNVMTFNVRYDNPNDGANRWELRVPLIEKYLKEVMPDIVGMQEVRHNQVLDLMKIMPGYSYVGSGRDDGKQGGEYTPVFYREDIFNLLENSQFWLSETPEVPGSKSWDAAITRIVTWAKLEHKETGKEFYFFNTHFDHIGIEARKMSPGLIAQKIDSIAGNSPVILTGDFNIRKNDNNRGSGLYDNLIETLKNNASLTNTLEITETRAENAGSTSTGFRPGWQVGEVGDAIDYIFVNDHFRVESYKVDRVMQDSLFISDHWPVVSVVYF